MESRILIHAPIGKDARLIAQVLERTKVDSFICARATELLGELNKGAAALVLVDEALSSSLLKSLGYFLDEQPAWSDLPILVLSQRKLDSPEIVSAYLKLGNVTLLERPLQSVTLISAAKSALRARQRQYSMREVDRRKDEFLAMLAHELRNPLAPVSAASDLLKFPNLDREKIRQTSEIISRQVKHMTGLIDDLLDVSRVSRGLVTLDEELLDARQIINSAVEQVRPFIDSRKHRLTLHTSPQSGYIKGDYKRLVQILSNVLSNAAKYTPEGGEIIMSMDLTESDVVFTVRDNGIGISANVIAHIFELFVQAERTPDRTQGGLGIGLALVKNLVHLQGGKVTAHSAGHGKGSEFTLIFPRCDDPLSVEPRPVTSNKNSSQRLLILVVDDNLDAANMLGMFLELGGYEVKVVHSASAAIEAANASQKIDVCLLDIGLPITDGIELAKLLREKTSTANATFIAVTGYGQETDRRKTKEAGFHHHCVKPVNMQELLATLSTLSA